MSHKAILFSTRYIGKSESQEVKYLFDSPLATCLESKAMCHFFRTDDLFYFLFENDPVVKKTLSERKYHFRKELIDAGFSWKHEFEDEIEKNIIGVLQEEKCDSAFLDNMLDSIISSDEKIETEFRRRFNENPSAIIKNVIDYFGDTLLLGLNIGHEKKSLKQRFQIYEIPPTNEYSIFAVWSLKYPSLDGAWENALCEEIIQRGQREGYTYSDIYLFLHDKDIFTKEQTFGVKESHVYQNSTIHVAYFKHEYPDPVKSLLEKKGMNPDSVAKHAIELMSLPNLEKIKSLLNKGVINWDAIMTFVEKLPEEEKVKQLFIKEKVYSGKELSEIKKKVKTRINEIQSIDEK